MSAGDADEAVATLFFGADIPHIIINTELRKAVVNVLKAAPASYADPNRDRLGNDLLPKLDAKTATSRAVSK